MEGPGLPGPPVPTGLFVAFLSHLTGDPNMNPVEPSYYRFSVNINLICTNKIDILWTCVFFVLYNIVWYHGGMQSKYEDFNPWLPIVEYMHTLVEVQSLQSEMMSWQPNPNSVYQKLYRSLMKKAFHFESVHLGRNWSQDRGNGAWKGQDRLCRGSERRRWSQPRIDQHGNRWSDNCEGIDRVEMR